MNALAAALENSRVRLRLLTAADTELLVQLAADPAIWHTPDGISMATLPMHTAEQRRHYVQQALAEMQAGRAWAYITHDQQTGQAVGSTRYGNIALHEGRVEIGWTWLVPAAQRTGINRAAKLLMLDHAFHDMGINRIEFRANAMNHKSRAALAGIGATYEGLLRQHMLLPDGRVRDTVYYSILRSEWPAIRAARFAHIS